MKFSKFMVVLLNMFHVEILELLSTTINYGVKIVYVYTMHLFILRISYLYIESEQEMWDESHLPSKLNDIR